MTAWLPSQAVFSPSADVAGAASLQERESPDADVAGLKRSRWQLVVVSDLMLGDAPSFGLCRDVPWLS